MECELLNATVVMIDTFIDDQKHDVLQPHAWATIKTDMETVDRVPFEGLQGTISTASSLRTSLRRRRGASEVVTAACFVVRRRHC